MEIKTWVVLSTSPLDSCTFRATRESAQRFRDFCNRLIYHNTVHTVHDFHILFIIQITGRSTRPRGWEWWRGATTFHSKDIVRMLWTTVMMRVMMIISRIG